MTEAALEPDNKADESPRASLHINALVEKLATDAALALSQRPDGELAGVVIEKKAPEFKQWRPLIEPARGQGLSDRWVAGLARRDDVFATLASGGGPPAIAWSEKATSQPGGWLPIVVVSRHGSWLTQVEVPPGPEQR